MRQMPENLENAIDSAIETFENRRGFRPPHLYVYLRPEVFWEDPCPSHRGPTNLYYYIAGADGFERVEDPDGAVTYLADDIQTTPPGSFNPYYIPPFAVSAYTGITPELPNEPSVMFKQHCNHEYTQYTGLQETFEYCKHCDERR